MRSDSQLITNPHQALRAGVSLADATALLEHAQEVATSDPAAGLPLVRTAVRAAHLTGVRCVRTRAFRALASTHCSLADFSKSERTFAVAFGISDGCQCCLPGLWRSVAYLRSEQGRHSGALQAASDSIRLYESQNRRGGLGKAVFIRGVILERTGNAEKAVADFQRSLSLISPSMDQDFYLAAQNSLIYSLAKSPRPDLVNEAAARLPGVRKLHNGLKIPELLRAKHRWVEGSVYARQAEIAPRRHRYGLRCKAAFHLRPAVKLLRKLDRLELMACAADLAAVEYHISRERLEQTLDTPGAPELADLWRGVRSAVREPEPVFWAALEALRSATVERGCTPPLVPYGLATGW